MSIGMAVPPTAFSCTVDVHLMRLNGMCLTVTSLVMRGSLSGYEQGVHLIASVGVQGGRRCAR